MESNIEVDFVLLWVDNNDPKWQSDFELHNKGYSKASQTIDRFRDWNLLPYWFRLIEKNATWVRKIHFVTYGHLPNWLDLSHPKLNIVNHSDFITKDKLPTFNSRVIELYISHIKGLSEHFVLFNDDTYLLNKSNKNDFFKRGLPVDTSIFNALNGDGIDSVILNNIKVVNKHFQKNLVIRRWFFKLFSPKNGFHLFRSFLLLPWPKFTGFYNPHQPQAYLKSVFFEVWNLEPELLDDTTSCRFRRDTNVNHYLIRFWQLVTGRFYPSKSKSLYCTIKEDSLDALELALFSKRYLTICMNDNDSEIESFSFCKTRLNQLFHKLVPEKSLFEL